MIGPDGVPVETPEVQAAKAHHYAEYAKTLSRPGQNIPDTQEYGHGGGEGHYSAPAPVQYSHAPAYYKGPGGPPAPLGHDGQVVETPEVQHAKAAHFAAYAEAASRAGYGGHGHGGHYRRRRGIYGDYHVPVLDHNGVPVETPEVQAAKAHHFAEYAKVLSRPGQDIPDVQEYSHDGGAGHYSPSPVHYSAPIQYSAPAHYASAPAYSHNTYHGPYAEIGHDGRPIETHEVQAAKAAHFAAYNAAKAGQYGHHYY